MIAIEIVKDRNGSGRLHGAVPRNCTPLAIGGVIAPEIVGVQEEKHVRLPDHQCGGLILGHRFC